MASAIITWSVIYYSAQIGLKFLIIVEIDGNLDGKLIIWLNQFKMNFVGGDLRWLLRQNKVVVAVHRTNDRIQTNVV